MATGTTACRSRWARAGRPTGRRSPTTWSRPTTTAGRPAASTARPRSRRADMSALSGILPKLLAFGASMLVGAAVASVAVSVVQARGPVSGAVDGTTPQYVLAGADTPAGPGPVVAFN